MPVNSHKKQLPVVIALLVLVGLMGVLLTMNYRVQIELQERIRQRIQDEVTISGERLNFIVQRFLAETAQLAESPEVDAFFKNRALGMSMKYGLSASLSIVSNLFAHRAANPGFEDTGTLREKSIYTAFFLLDENLQVLTAWPAENAATLPPAVIDELNDRRSLLSQDNRLYLVNPIVNERNTVGFVVAVIPYSVLYRYLQPGLEENQTTYLIRHENRIVFPAFAPEQQRELLELEERLGRAPDRGAFQLEKGLPLAGLLQRRFSDDVVFFQTTLPKFSLTIYQAEDAASLYDRRQPLLLLVVMLLFSTSLILFSLRLVRSSSRNQALSENLAELQLREAALSEKNRELELIISGAELGTWLWDAPSGRIVINDQWARMLGYEPSDIELHLDSWIRMVHPQDWEQVKTRLDAHLAGETPIYSADHRLRHRSGKWIWVRDIGQVFSRASDGRPLLVRGIHMDITEIKTALEQAEAFRREADSVITNFLDSLLVVDQELRISRANKETCQLLGYRREQLLGLPVSELFVESIDEINRIFNFPREDKTCDLEELRNIELTFRTRAGGEILPVSVNLARLRDEKGATIGVVAGARDVSKLNQALQRTEEQKRVIEKILNVVPGGLLVVGQDCLVLQQNQTFQQLLQDWCRQYGFKDRDLQREILRALADALVQGLSGEFSLAGERSELSLEYHASEDILEDAGFNRVIFLHDVTSRRKAESIRKLHSTVLEQTSEGVLITDTDGMILFTNLAAQKMSGYSGDEMQGKKTSLFKSGVQNSAFYSNLWHRIQAGVVWKGSITNRSRSGDLFEIEATISPVRAHKDGCISHYVSLWRDVSQERALQQQLLQAQKLEAVGQLAAGVAHEINTPIQYIQNNLSFLQGAFADIDKLVLEVQRCGGSSQDKASVTPCVALPEMVDHSELEFLREEIPQGIREALDGVDHVAKIVSAMKEFSHPGKNDHVISDLNRIIQNAVLVTRNEWKYTADLETDLAPDLPLLCCDPGGWSQVLLNLIVNSSDAIKERGAQPWGLIRITTRSLDKQIELTVTDNGAGIPQEVLSHIFEPFFTTKMVGKGTGQGLAIVYDIVVNKHHGTIHCDSRVGDGTTMRLCVPAAMTEESGS